MLQRVCIVHFCTLTNGWSHNIIMHLRVEDKDSHMYEVGYEVHVALRASPSTFSTERLLIGKPKQQESQIVCHGVERWIIEPRTLLQVVSVPVEFKEIERVVVLAS